MNFKRIHFPKIDFNGRGRRINAVDVEVRMSDDGELTICGNVWNSMHTDIIRGGQCLDSILPFFKDNDLFVEIHNLWKKHHLNHLKAGTHKQTAALAKFHKEHPHSSYTEDCEYLKSVGLYEDDLADGEVHHNGIRKGYKYGTAWLHWAIPETDLERIAKILAIQE